MKQGEEVQLSDKESVEARIAQHASDPLMRQNRIDTAVALVKAVNLAGKNLHNRGVDFHELGDTRARDSYEGVGRIAIIAAALGAGAIQLIGVDNRCPALALIRQFVESEFVLWRFQNNISLIPEWLTSDRDTRDEDNSYRQKDYSSRVVGRGVLVAAVRDRVVQAARGGR